MRVHEAKEKLQTRGLRIWYRSNCNGTLEYATGTGKTRCGVRAAEWILNRAGIKNARILILAPTEKIRDEEWKTEFKKCKMTPVWKKVEAECIQTACRFEGQHYDLVIADEVHNFLSPEYFKFFEKNTMDRVLGLSAYVPKPSLENLNKIAPIVDSVSIEQAREWGLVSPYDIFNIACTFTDAENEEYRSLTNIIDFLKEKKGLNSWKHIGERKRLVYDALDKNRLALEVVKKLRNEYGIIFTETIYSAQQLSQILYDELGVEAGVYHSKMSKDDRKEVIRKFSDGRTNNKLLIAVRGLNEGANLPRIVWTLIMANTSKPKEQIQRIGRVVRFEPDKRALILRAYIPYTVEYDWIKSAQWKQNSKFIRKLEEINWGEYGV